MSNKLYMLLFLVIFTCALMLGFKVGKNANEQKHMLEIAKINENYTKELQQQAEKAQSNYKKYVQAREQINNLHDTNDKLINSLYTNTNNNNLQEKAGANTPTSINPTNAPELSKEVARDINTLARDADEVAEYAKECYLFLKELQEKQEKEN